ncbi:MAG TPA: ribonuclease D [Steroidobacteraceae bacterium]
MSAIISDRTAFAQVCAELGAHQAVGLDTEFMRERTYFAQLCLVQLSFGERALCIDSLALPDLTALAPIMAAPNVCKVLHAARQDLEVLAPAVGAGLQGVFDTQVAAALIGMPAQVGYADLVAQLLGAHLHKAETRTDWSRRPLTAGQLAYALDDVRYLLPLRQRLSERLESLGRSAWLAEEMAQLDAAAGSLAVDPDEAWRRIKGISDLDPARRSLARALAAWRERRAIEADRPRSWIVSDIALRDLVLRVPRSRNELARTAELPDGVLNHSGEQILSVIEAAGLPASLPPLPRRQRPEAAETERLRQLSLLTQQTGRELGIAPEILATRRDLQRLLNGEREGGPLSGWRRGVIGERLLQAL